jgi:23S rRNA pseudouridine1911/1915/1917 synthase
VPSKIISNKDNLQVLYEDNHLIAVNKRVGDIVQGDRTGDLPLSEVVKQYIAEKYNKPGAVFLGVVHRLDRPTSGVVVFARTSKALSRMNRIFSDRGSKKVYWAIVKNKPGQLFGTLIHYLSRNQKQNKSYAYDKEVAGSKRAELDYRTIRSLDRYHLLEIDLKTGRHHQIRAQLASMGCPIKGDLKYGSERSNKDGGIHLHARSITFSHPVKKEELTIIAPPPKDPLWDHCQ